MLEDKIYDVIIIGGGQSALACGYYLRRTNLEYVILDNQVSCGGAWPHAWDSLTLFSPAEHSSLPGWLMPKSEHEFPTKTEVIDYVCQYEKRYKLPVERPFQVKEVKKEASYFTIITDKSNFYSKTIISATGTFGTPFIPNVPGREIFKGTQLHSAYYQKPEGFTDQKVLIVGEGNSGAQILAEVSKVADTVWTTRKTPEFLPDDVDGRVLFDQASAKYYAEKKGEKFDASKYNLGNIVMVPSVKEARKRDVLHSKGQFKAFTESGVLWVNGKEESFDAVIWCTGFGFATDHLKKIISTDERGKIKTKGTRSVEEENLWLVGYGGWTGFASATLIGVGRSARATIKEIQTTLDGNENYQANL
ncbi:monooxygenase [Marivirga tractuosa]|uniref:Flavin-containing monooxygenase n=1 Tax=Marivirga tractuosa (strain ATCC 23168 / DSM 4126 / NBRC 15989 / NCIMB 1408 / VKM B-1430 / H-43) TaxID=643867 RepID=E4TPP3_MARTH|nr:ArsO family NAD(P)H-dependent flavin-containing monooxygenase [Marivirga tractuosa]ADR22607.1 Flavin-containing monooxygenase [Marivirga tractuosa DSM 4126]BDD16722.1 monooxygenase [Marivirga tractuosa]